MPQPAEGVDRVALKRAWRKEVVKAADMKDVSQLDHLRLKAKRLVIDETVLFQSKVGLLTHDILI